jgi:general secretion pathway protein G
MLSDMETRSVNSNWTRRVAGFTLIEILVVIVIITILAGIVTVNIVRKPGEARVAAATMQIKQLQTALQVYRTEQGRYPTQEQGLEALVAKPASAPIPENYPAEGYLDSRRVPRDPWNNEFIYLVPGRKNEPFEIISYGSDGEPGGTGDAADISSSEL